MLNVTLGGYWYADAIRESDLPSASRQIALTLAGVADNTSAAVRRDVSLNKLKRWTGLSRSTIRAHLNLLEAAGWLQRDRPTVAAARMHHETTAYSLTVPADALRSAEARAGRALGLGQEKTQARATVDPGLGRQRTKARAPAAPISIGTRYNAPRGARCESGKPIAADGTCCGEEHERRQPA